jgi:pyruvate kinase
MRKTKIVCTLGPSSSDYATIKKMAEAGMNVARINMSHGNYTEHERVINIVKKVRQELNVPIALMLDTKGPELRIKTFEGGSAELKEGNKFILTSRECQGGCDIVSVCNIEFSDNVQVGDVIYLDNALIKLEVTEKIGRDVVCKVVSGGVLKDRKSVNVPQRPLRKEYLSEDDKEDLLFAIKNDFDFIAASFVCTAQNIKDIREFVKSNGGEIDIIAKIESARGVKNAGEIIRESDGIMVARGDLGVEIPFEEIPFIQKTLIKDARMLGKRVITATEMLETMSIKPRPTRAETSDVGNAVYDETSAVMLSCETAAGKYPVEAVRVMSKICEATENHIDYTERFKSQNVKIRNVADAVSHSTCNTAIDLNAAAIVVFTRSGITARMVSRFRPQTVIMGMTDDIKAYRRLALSWGVYPVLTHEYHSVEELYDDAVEVCRRLNFAKAGDLIVITAGVPLGKSGMTNMIKVEEIR